MSFVASWNDYRPLDSLVILFDALERNQSKRDGDEEKTTSLFRLFQYANDAGGAVLNKSEMMISIRDGSITKAEDQ